jgi:hypothetical protein
MDPLLAFGRQVASKALAASALLLLSASPSWSQTDSQIEISCAQAVYAIQSNAVYLRNLNTWDKGGKWMGCCYNYYFDLTIPGGQAMFSDFLSCRLANQTLSLWKTDPTTAGPIELVGNM